MLSIYLSIRIVRSFEVCALATRFADTPVMVRTATFIFHTVHAVTVAIVVIPAEAGSSSRTTSWAFVVSCQRITSRKFPPTLIAGMRPFSRMQFGVTLEVVQAAESRLACLTDVRLFLTVRQQMALQVVMPREVRGAIWAFVSLV